MNRILFVENDKTLQILYREELEEEGYEWLREKHAV